MKKVHHGKLAIRNNATWKKRNMEIMQLDQSATQKECNMKKVQRERKFNTEKVTREKYGEKNAQE